MSSIALPWRPEPVSSLWLGDNCPCPECRVEATSEHRVVIGSMGATLDPRRIDCVDGRLRIDWGDHVSTYSQARFDEILQFNKRPTPTPVFWDRSIEVPRFSYDTLENAATFVALARDFARFGVVVVEGVPCEPGMVERFIERWAPVREVPFGRVHDVLVDPDGYNIAHTAEALPPHNDMASIQWPPSGQLIHMLENDATGGESIVVDGLAICEALDPADVETLATIPAPFRQFSATAETWACMPLIRRNPDGTVAQLRYSNQLLQPMDPFDEATERFYEAYHRLSGLILDPTFHAVFRSNAGDMQMLHGHRVMHGRTSFQPGSGARHLQDIYFEFEDIMNVAYRLDCGTRNQR